MKSILFSLVGLLGATLSLNAQAKGIQGVLPTAADGRPLNLDFETGDLRDWTAEGDAFKQQPILGDTVKPRRSDMSSRHQGKYWIGGYERFGDKPQGTLTSVPFRVTHPWASFLVAGGPHKVTSVELVLKEGGKVFHRASGPEEEDLRREVVDLRGYQGKEIFIRVVDLHSGHWGHVNFDDFRFHAQRPKFPARPRREPPPPPDKLAFEGLSPKKAAEAMTVPPGFQVVLAAGEPDVHQPVALCLDDRGRVWIAEAHCYPRRKKTPGFRVGPKDGPGDRILIFEDTDGDGVFDRKKVFMEGLNLVSGIEVGFGGVWIGAAPYLLFVPLDREKDLPAGPAQVLLDGFGWHDTHETLNSFIWGPDGWLYGCHGVFTHSRVGKPGTPDGERVPLNAGFWRYHPVRHEFEVFAHGTSNPWGIDFDDMGQAFCNVCVIPHSYHLIQGGRYLRQAGQHFQPHTYADLGTIAEHRHWIGGTPHGGNNRSDKAGGGHAHCGTMIYLGGSWPEKYRNQIFMGNIHGRRINMDAPRPNGSGYVTSFAPDLLLANDAWARFINLRYGPDGDVWLIDWYDKQACHRNEPEIWDRSNGRIYKIRHADSKWAAVNLEQATWEELVDHQRHANDWFVRHARRRLQEKFAEADATQGDKKAWVRKQLAALAEKGTDRQRLRALWALHVTGGLEKEHIERGLNDAAPYLRGWTLQLALEKEKAGADLLARMAEMARKDPSPVVRLYLASACQRLPLEDRWDILPGLLAHGEDAKDHNLPLMCWYALEPLGALDPSRALALAGTSPLPNLPGFMARRIASSADPKDLAVIVEGLEKAKTEEVRWAFLQGTLQALKGRTRVAMPKNWSKVFAGHLAGSPAAGVRQASYALAAAFGDKQATAILRKVLAEGSSHLDSRMDALAVLVQARDESLPPLLHGLLKDKSIRAEAIKALGQFEDPGTPKKLFGVFGELPAVEKRLALATLAVRKSYAGSLLDGIENKTIPAKEVPAEVIRQLRQFGDKALDARIEKVWGIVRATPADKLKTMAKYQGMVLKAGMPPDLALGHALYRKTCFACHKLFGEGGDNGPELTGSNRADLKYLLENILDPSAVIPKEYAVTVFETKDGRLITGILRGSTPAAYTISTATETLTLPREQVLEMTGTTQSLMPENQLDPLSEHEVRSLVAYLRSAQPPPKGDGKK